MLPNRWEHYAQVCVKIGRMETMLRILGFQLLRVRAMLPRITGTLAELANIIFGTTSPVVVVCNNSRRLQAGLNWFLHGCTSTISENDYGRTNRKTL